jgi:hypothetical protein
MNSARGFAIAVAALILSGHVTFAQDVSRYRGYVLESSVESVMSSNGARGTDARTIHERPAKIQSLEWRAPYMSSGSERGDPVREIAFMFIDDALYQIVVSYDREKTDGLTNNDVINTLTTTYGAPVPRSAKTPAMRPEAAYASTIVLAQWETAAASVTLVGGAYTPEFQLILISKPLISRARDATREAVRLDAVDARRESQQRQKEAAEASAVRDKERAANKASFRP